MNEELYFDDEWEDEYIEPELDTWRHNEYYNTATTDKERAELVIDEYQMSHCHQTTFINAAHLNNILNPSNIFVSDELKCYWEQAQAYLAPLANEDGLITIYHGWSGFKPVKNAVSWSVNKTVAEFFAARDVRAGDIAKVATLQIDYTDVVLVLAERCEDEVLLPRGLRQSVYEAMNNAETVLRCPTKEEMIPIFPKVE